MFASDRVLALDVGAFSLKMAEFVGLKSGGIQLVKFAIGTLEYGDEGESDRLTYIVTTIRELMREQGIKPGPVVMSVSGQSVFSRFVKLPPVDSDKVYKIILYEAQQNVPFPMEEVVWDYQLIGGGEGELDVMLAAIKAEIIENLTDSVTAGGLDPDLVDVAPTALYNAVRYNYEEIEGCTLIVDIGARSTDLIFLEDGHICIRCIPVAGNAITQQIMREFKLSFEDAEEMKRAHAYVAFGGAYEGPPSEVADRVSKSVRTVMTRMHAEINRSINFYRSQQGGSAPKTILLTGGTSVIPYTDTFLRDKLKVPVDYLNPFRNVAVSEEISAEEIAHHVHLLGEVVGLGLRRVLSCPIELNLLPPKIRARKALRKKVPYFAASAVGLVLLLGIWSGFLYKMGTLARQNLEGVRGRVEELGRVEAQLIEAEHNLRSVREKVDFLLDLGDKRTRWLEILDGIHAVIPDGMWLVALVPHVENAGDSTSGGEKHEVIRRIEITGRAYLDKVRRGEPIREFRDRLRASPFFTDETDIMWQPSPGPEDYVRQFKIVLVLQEPFEP